MISRKNRILSAVLAALTVLSMTGCGQEETVYEENIELLEPVGTSAAYEQAAYRNFFNYKLVSGYVCPSVTEYGFSSTQQFKEYLAFPGEPVKKNGPLASGDRENIDKQIEAMEKKIEDAAKYHEESVKELKEDLKKPAEMERIYREALEKLEDEMPPESIRVFSEETGEWTETDNPDYTAWLAGYKDIENQYRDYLITVQKLEASISQQEELYLLDSNYDRYCLDVLKKERLQYMVTAKEDGVVMSYYSFIETRWGSYYSNYWKDKDEPFIAVGDPQKMEIRCDYVNKSVVGAAEEVYAYINGQKYEVEYHPMDPDEYTKVTKDGDKAYATFTIVGEAPEVQCGDFAVVVLVSGKRTNVLSLSKEAVHNGEGGSYVYVLSGTESVRTPVKVGMKDNLNVEILSGITPEDHILSDTESLKGTGEAKITKGAVSYAFSGKGYLTYPSYEWVRNPMEYGTSYFVEEYVTDYEQVTKGQLLCKIRVERDELTLKRQESRLQREIERLNDLHKDYDDDRQNKYYLKQVEQKEKTISELQETIEKIKRDAGVREIRSPMDGIITGHSTKRKTDDLIAKNEILYTISDSKTSYLEIEDKSHVLNYGNIVQVNFKDASGMQRTANGMVVTVNPIALSPKMRSDTAMIKVDEEDIGYLSAVGSRPIEFAGRTYWDQNSFETTASVRKMENVLLIPKKAVVDKNGQTFAKVIGEDGKPCLMSFIAGGSDSSNYWIIDGLTEGTKLCLE